MPVLKKAAGLVTNPNEINKREGSLEVADNVIIDSDNIIEPRRGFEDFGASFATSNDRLSQIMAYKERVLRHYNSTIQYDSTGTGNFQTFSGSYNEVSDGVRLKSFEYNGNFYFTTSSGIKKISATSASDFTTDSGFIENSGAPRATGLESRVVYTTGGFLPPDSKVAYRAVWGKRDNNNVLLLGYPSERSILTNQSSQTLIAETFEIEFTSGTVGDYSSGGGNERYVSFSSKNVDYFLYFTTPAAPDVPSDSGTIGRTGIEVDIDGLTTASEIAVAAANALGTLNEQFDVSVLGAVITVVSKESGNNLTDAASSTDLTAATTTVITQGETIEGDFANAELDLLIPDEVDSTDYFYQIYRTAVLTAQTGVTVDELDPGDEMNLVFEANVTSAQITAGKVTGIEDITPETFRASGAFLYTNPQTGQGILQANEKPPIAQDVAVFRNTTFYANTKTRHKEQIDLLAVSGFTSGTSSIVIGNSTDFSEYTFVGATQVQSLTTVADVADSLDGTYFLLNSARNERKYYVWFTTGAGAADPLISGRSGISVEIDTGDTAAAVAEKLSNVLDAENDFDSSFVTNTVTITWAKNGNVDDAADGTTGFTFNVPSTQGDGEDAAANEVLLSSLVSVGQALEETALSLVRVINQDANSPVNAFYISGADDVPGNILLESRDLVDDPFFVGTTDSAIQSKFSPELALVETLTAISTDSPPQITASGHGLSTGNTIYLYNTNSTPVIQGKYKVAVIDANTFTIPETVTGAGTSGNWFLANVESDNEVKPNRLYYSKVGQPEAVPILNYLDIGPQDRAILRILSLRDNLFVLKEDGVYIVTGTTAPNFGSRLLDGSIKFFASDTADVLNNRIYCLVTEGVASISEVGVQIISRPIENNILTFNRYVKDAPTVPFGVAYQSDSSYIIWLPSEASDTVATQAYRYNVTIDTWVRWTTDATCAMVNDGNNKLYIGDGTRNYSQEERKNGDRTDYADRSFTLSIGADAVEGTSITLSSTADIVVGDVIYQLQYLTIAQYNRLLLKLDNDPGLDDSDYYSTLIASAGDNLTDKMDALNTKLVADDSSGTITAATYSSTFTTLQTEFNTLISQLNTSGCDTIYKNYKQSTGSVPYETIITANDRVANEITVVYLKPFLLGNVQIYKSIKTEVEYGPIDFGAADQLKQVREGTIIFDQNNFYSAVISYASDRSANFDEIAFTFFGSGYWGGSNFGEFVWGGLGNEIPKRTLIPRQKQRCRYIKVKFEHSNAREFYKILGISLEPRAISTRGYR